jgi:hypothetical protein
MMMKRIFGRFVCPGGVDVVVLVEAVPLPVTVVL